MIRQAKAPSAGPTESTGSSRGTDRGAFATRGLARGSKGSGAPSRRLLPLGLLTAIVLGAFAFGATGAAFAAEPTATLKPVEVEYSTAGVAVKFESETEENETYFAMEYRRQGTQNWQTGPQPPFGPYSHGVKDGETYVEELSGLTAGVTYEVRVTSPPAPIMTFTTKSAPAPIATIEPVTGITGTEAHFEGSVDTNAPAGPYTAAQEDAYRTEWHFECTPECPGLTGGTVQAGEEPQDVAVHATELEPNTPYEVRLVAKNAGDPVVVQREFKTLAPLPSVKATAGASDGKGGYFLEGVVNAFNSNVTDCHFEYGPTAAYVFQAACSPEPVGRNERQQIAVGAEMGTYRIGYRGQFTSPIAFDAPASLVQAELEDLPKIGAGNVSVTGGPGSGGAENPYVVDFQGDFTATNAVPLETNIETLARPSLGSPSIAEVTTLVEGGNNKPTTVEAHVTGLTPGATYHFRVVMTTVAGTKGSEDRIFVPTLAPPSGGCANEQLRIDNNSLALPECRAYEQMTSPIKGGNEANYSYFDQAGHILYSSTSGNIAGSGQGNYLGANYYAAERKPSGWETLTNLNGPTGTYFAEPYNIAPFPVGGGLPELYSEDFQSALYVTRKKNTPTFDRTLYLRNPDGSFTEISHQNNNVEGATPDLSHIIVGLDGGAGLDPGPTWGTGLYEFVGTENSVPTEVDLDQAGDPTSVCEPTQFGVPASAKFRSISKDGGTVVWIANGNCGPESPSTDELWARVGGSTSYKISKSQCTRTSGDPGGACNAPSNPEWVQTTPDGSTIFFTTNQQLVNGDTDQTKDLYAYELPSPGNPNPSPALVQVSAGPDEADVNVVRISEDGSTVYFTATGVLAGNDGVLGESAKDGDRNLYMWRRNEANPDGETTFIARLRSEDAHAQTTTDGGYLLISTATPLTLTDTDTAKDLYRYDAGTGEIVRVSVNIAGVGGNVDGLDADFETPKGGLKSFHPFHQPPQLRTAISADGSEIVFETKEALDGAVDGNEEQDVYLWKGGHTTLISTGSSGGEATGGAITDSGIDIYFSTRQQLSPTDVDGTWDAYDARIGGGFAAETLGGCSGETCQPPVAGEPAEPQPSSDKPNGSGNVPPGQVSIRALSKAAKAKLVTGGRVSLKLKLTQPGRVTVVGMAKIGGKRRQVFATTVNAPNAGQVKVPIKLSQPALAELQRSGKLKIELSVTFGGAAPKKSSLVLKAPPGRAGTKRKGA